MQHLLVYRVNARYHEIQGVKLYLTQIKIAQDHLRPGNEMHHEYGI